MNNQYLLQGLADLIAQLDTDELIAQFNIDTIYLADTEQQEIQIPLLWADNSPHMLNTNGFKKGAQNGNKRI